MRVILRGWRHEVRTLEVWEKCSIDKRLALTLERPMARQMATALVDQAVETLRRGPTWKGKGAVERGGVGGHV